MRGTRMTRGLAALPLLLLLLPGGAAAESTGTPTTAPERARPTELVVTRDDDPAPDGCAPADCSLREAVLDANASGAPSRVLVGAREIALTILGVEDDTGATGDLDVLVEIELVGEGPERTVVRGTGDRVVHVPPTAPEGTRLRLTDLTLADGLSFQGGLVQQDAVAGALEVRGCRLTGGTADFGGALGNEGQAARILVVGSVLEGNRATLGGAIADVGLRSRLTLVDTVVRDNEARFIGGGIMVGRAGGRTRIVRGGITGNRVLSEAPGGRLVGGGLAVLPFTGVAEPARLTLAEVEITGNVLTSAADVGGQGAGLYVDGPVAVDLGGATIHGNVASVRGAVTDPQVALTATPPATVPPVPVPDRGRPQGFRLRD